MLRKKSVGKVFEQRVIQIKSAVLSNIKYIVFLFAFYVLVHPHIDLIIFILYFFLIYGH